jgi:ribosomal protein S18 acetylase RimI-like enzyme
MRSVYGGLTGFVEVEHAHHNICNVLQVFVNEDFRRLGLGTSLMRCVMRDADKEGVELWLVASPTNMTTDELETFYRRLGFNLRGSYMIRLPLNDKVLSQ